MTTIKEDEKQVPVSELDHVEAIGANAVVPQADIMLSELVAQDKTPWHRKPNLRRLYLLFIGSVLCIETTSGYDASVVNGLQAVPKWVECASASASMELVWLITSDFNRPAGTTLGLIGSMYALGVSGPP